jgi:(5-formylfuran-3-yl)methyl phosphate synthase
LLSILPEKPGLLASVLNAAEAAISVAAGAHVIDCKNPSAGALGALDANDIASVVSRVGAERFVSATIGDLPTDAALMVKAAEQTASLGVDIVKVGFFDERDPRGAITALGKADLGKARLVAVLMADRAIDLSLMQPLARAGFVGVMLDTADKSAGSLTEVRTTSELVAFLSAARAHGLLAGLAGSLRRSDIAPLVALAPDLLGFRGALCAGGRTGAIDPGRTKAIAHELNAARHALHLKVS